MMREMSSSTWRRRGSSIIFDKITLSTLIGAGPLVSLREALGWFSSWPSEPPGKSQTVLVGGLETLLDVLKLSETENFLKHRVNPFIQEFQTRWDQCGLVFGFGTHERSFELTTTNEEVLYVRRDGERVRLSYALWDGSATMNLARLVRDEQGKRITVGYHVARIS